VGAFCDIGVGAGVSVTLVSDEFESIGLADGVGDVCALASLTGDSVALQAEKRATNVKAGISLRVPIFHLEDDCNRPVFIAT
jgi:hypothetical protein